MSSTARKRRSGIDPQNSGLTTNRHGPAGTKVPSAMARVETEDDHNVYLYHGEEPTHVVVPIENYERLVKSEMALHCLRKAEDDDAGWVNADDFAIELATESVVKARKTAGLTQVQLAKKLKMPQSQISRIERNPDRTTVRTLKKIAKALGVDVRALLGSL